MYQPKKDVYTALNSISGATVRQGSQKTVATIPSITFYVSDNTARLNLQNEIVSQEVLITVDIWAKNSSSADSLLSQAEANLRAIGYRLDFQMDVPDPNDICHINTQFIGIK